MLQPDSGPGVGSGHLARCFAIGQRWSDRGGEVVLTADDVPDLWRDRCRAEGFEVVARPAVGTAPTRRADWTVLDGYRWDDADLVQAREESRFVLLIADHGTPDLRGADLVVDQNLDDPSAPRRYDAPEVLLGPRYALLRRELRQWRLRSIGAGAPEGGRPSVVVSLGGDPPAAATALVEQVLADRRLAGCRTTVLLGRSDVVPALAGATVALSAAGSTAWELCAFGLPTVYVATADNQEPVGRAIDAAGAGIYAGRLEELAASDLAGTLDRLLSDPERRRQLAEAARDLVDGVGVSRVVARMRSHLLTVREAGPADRELLWEWASDAEVRANSFSSDPIPFEDHVVWFDRLLADPGRRQYVVERIGPGGSAPIGQIRFDIGPGAHGGPGHDTAAVAEIGVSVAPEHRGDGWGGPLICAGVWRFTRDCPQVTALEAKVKPGNHASGRSFVEADFDGPTTGDPSFSRYVRTVATERPDG